MAQRGAKEEWDTERPFLEGSNDRISTFENFKVSGGDDLVVSWPYKTPSPEFMARLGFYFTPTRRLRDRVTCVCCKKVQSTWKNVKDPSQHHLKKNPTCHFSLMHRYISQRTSDPDFEWSSARPFDDPLSTEATQIRMETFGANWPYDNIDGANPTSRKMVDAGFMYYPQDKEDDLAICIYCGVSLEGWEHDDDPMTEHRKRASEIGCYFLSKYDEVHGNDNSFKRKSEEPLLSPIEKRSKSMIEASTIEEQEEGDELEHDDDDDDDDQEPKDESIVKENQTLLSDDPSLLLAARPKRVRKFVKKLDLDLSSSEVDEDDDQSFSITANSERLNSEEEYFESSNKKPNKTKSLSATVRKSSRSTSTKPKSISASPLKKSKILDSSFDNDGLFDINVKQGSQLDLQPLLRSGRSSPQRQLEKSPLHDITNVGPSSPRKLAPKIEEDKNEEEENDESDDRDGEDDVKHDEDDDNNSDDNDDDNEEDDDDDQHEEEDEDEIILVSNSKEDITYSKHTPKKKSLVAPEKDVQKVCPVPKDDSLETLRPDSRQNDAVLGSPEHELPLGESSLQNSPAPTPSPSSSSQLHPSPLDSKAPTNSGSPTKSEHLESRSSRTDLRLNKTVSRLLESPKRSASPFLDPTYKGSDRIDSIIGPGDNPIEESTDHNIHIANVSKVVKQPAEEPAENESSGSFHSAASEAPDTYWRPTDTDKLFEALDDLETAKTFLNELQILPYELNDDVDGRVSCFINEMPDEELEMTIEEWVHHTAKTGRLHLESVCSKMLNQFDEECARALEKLKRLATVD